MSWKFWGKKDEKTGDSGERPIKLPRPKDIPGTVGRYLVVDLGQDPEWVWNLKGAVRPKNGIKDAYDVRVFSDNDASMRRVVVKDYHSLDEHPDLILFDGWFNKKTNEARIEKKVVPKATPRAA